VLVDVHFILLGGEEAHLRMPCALMTRPAPRASSNDDDGSGGGDDNQAPKREREEGG
jgi:hypothetical protein